MKFDNDTKYEIYSKLIDKCPICDCVIDPRVINAIDVTENNNLHGLYLGNMIIVTFYCKKCNSYFHAYFINSSNNIHCIDVYPLSTPKITFSPSISSLSPNFVTCFTQSAQAESEKLYEIAGIGYRKSIEYLIKDFVSSLFPKKEDEIKSDTKLSNVILNRLPDNPEFSDIRDLTRCAWILGCDFVHYEHNYKDYDLGDLKLCIDHAVRSIDAYTSKQKYKSIFLKK